MLCGIELVNFMSFAHESITGLDKYSTIAVSGENGDGKSALLESIYYVLYGGGRTSTLAKLVREGREEMEVSLHLFDREDKDVTVKRGISKGKGWAQYYVGDDLKAQGAAVEKIVNEQLLGINASTFLLTNFFGLGANDTLMKVRPSERLETMQSIANINIYSDAFHPSASKRSSGISQKLNESRGALTSLVESRKSVTNVQESIKSIETLLIKKRLGVDKLQILQKEIADGLDRLTSFESERKVLSSKLYTVLSQQKVYKKEIEDIQDELAGALDRSNSILGCINEANKEIEGFNEKDLEEKKKEASDLVAKYGAAISLRETALKNPHDANCPLCGGELNDESCTKEKWTKEIQKLQPKFDKSNEVWGMADRSLKDLRKGEKRIALLKSEREALLHTQGRLNASMEKRKPLIQRISSDIASYKQRLDVLGKKIKELDRTFPKAGDLQKRIGEGISEIGRLEGNLEALQESLAEAEDHKREVQSKKRELRKLLLDKEATELAVTAFSRYGIPLNLIQGLCGKIEEEATVVYNSFDSGQIEVADTDDRGKPGIDFFLFNRTGRRSYDQLSEGQKVMVFLSVRLALSKIISKSKGIKHDFLVLDEITSHLSPNRRDDLTTLIIDVLGKSFSQIFMVSHSEIRDIFSVNFFVEKKDDVSSIALL
jgi:DNA repair exonuclease SbcCD ATPase subunit